MRLFVCTYMRLFSSSKELQVPYAPIFDGRLLLGRSLFSKKYSMTGGERLMDNED